MMKLHWSPRSPFARKVSIVLDEIGLGDQIERIPSVAIFAAPANPAILADNPLGKIPVLITEDGGKLFDSRVICEYLILRTGRDDLLPGNATSRIKHLRWQALGDGLTDILLLWRTERGRGDHASRVILDAMEAKTRKTLDLLETEAHDLRGTAFGLGHIAIVCALGQLDFRYGDSGWKAALPDLATWYADLSTRPSIAATAIVDDGAGPSGGDVTTPSFTYGTPT